ncbi:hypothetical protein PFISCL1PPCAC_28862, partial [Pristionchus fissidentatus]
TMDIQMSPPPPSSDASPPSPPSTSSAPPLLSLFAHDRLHSSPLLLLLYLPIGLPILIFRIFLGFHAFVVACLLRKANLLRGYVLRVMCGLCGIVVTSSGQPDPSTRVVVSNHVTHLDHLAIDLLHPCVLASVWNIPNLLRWCFGYVDLGAREGRQELVNQAKKFIQSSEPSLLAFPESALTSGKVGLLRFATWPFEVCPTVQPVSVRISRPLFDVESTVLGSAWWQDLFIFFALPATVIHITWLPLMKQEKEETVEQFALRVSKEVACDLSIVVTDYTSHDAVEAAKKHLAAKEAAANKKASTRAKLPPAKLDAAAMAIKQAHPTVAVVDIRRDLEMTHDPNQTIDRIKTGVLKASVVTNKKPAPSSSLSDPSEWRRLFGERKWAMIESNRARYLDRATRVHEAGDQ